MKLWIKSWIYCSILFGGEQFMQHHIHLTKLRRYMLLNLNPLQCVSAVGPERLSLGAISEPDIWNRIKTLPGNIPVTWLQRHIDDYAAISSLQRPLMSIQFPQQMHQNKPILEKIIDALCPNSKYVFMGFACFQSPKSNIRRALFKIVKCNLERYRLLEEGETNIECLTEFVTIQANYIKSQSIHCPGSIIQEGFEFLWDTLAPNQQISNRLYTDRINRLYNLALTQLHSAYLQSTFTDESSSLLNALANLQLLELELMAIQPETPRIIVKALPVYNIRVIPIPFEESYSTRDRLFYKKLLELFIRIDRRIPCLNLSTNKVAVAAYILKLSPDEIKKVCDSLLSEALISKYIELCRLPILMTTFLEVGLVGSFIKWPQSLCLHDFIIDQHGHYSLRSALELPKLITLPEAKTTQSPFEIMASLYTKLELERQSTKMPISDLTYQLITYELVFAILYPKGFTSSLFYSRNETIHSAITSEFDMLCSLSDEDLEENYRGEHPKMPLGL